MHTEKRKINNNFSLLVTPFSTLEHTQVQKQLCCASVHNHIHTGVHHSTAPSRHSPRNLQAWTVYILNSFFLLICADTRSLWPAMMETLTENHPLWPKQLSKQWVWENKNQIRQMNMIPKRQPKCYIYLSLQMSQQYILNYPFHRKITESSRYGAICRTPHGTMSVLTLPYSLLCNNH